MTTQQIKFYQDHHVGNVKGWHWVENDYTWRIIAGDWHSHYDAIKRNVSSYRNVIQAGGNQGMYPALLSVIFENVFTFEIDPLNYQVMCKNLKSVPNIIAKHVGLGAEIGRGGINRRTMTNTGMHQLTDGDEVDVVTIDSLNLNDVDFIWLDIEEGELSALKGAVETIETNKPVIMLENGHTDDITKFMKDLGYLAVDQSRMDTIYKC